MILKRIFDLCFTIPGVLLLVPLFLILAIWIKMDSPGPIFFRQGRVGKGRRLFNVFKFRTMVTNAEQIGTKVTVGKDPRITRSGNFLRKYKLDELPQLINVLKGEMSLVGPRPEVPEYVKYWPENIADIVLSVPPGITDYAAIEFRNENELLGKSDDPVAMYIEKIIPIKLNYYVKYVRKRNILLDVWLVIRTIKVILF